MHSDPIRLKVADVERRLAVHRQTLWRWVRDGEFPRPHYIGRERRWFLHDIQEWERQNIKERSPDTAHQATG